ncbi:hypothetical protein Droror1_Dr00025737 [Drosera rotundifolia]
MLEDQVAYLLQRYLGNYVRGLSKEALKISVWKGDVELTNMQLKPEALNALQLPIRVKAGFLGSVKLKVPWSRLGQDPVLVTLDRIFLLVVPSTQIEGYNEVTVQEAKRNLIRDMETKLLEKAQTEMNKSWVGSLIDTIIGNLRLSISNIHIRYEDTESNPGHPFAAGVTLEKLAAVTVDEDGNETFATGGALDHIQKLVELERLAVYLDSDTVPWYVNKPWEKLLPSEWSEIFKYGTKDGKAAWILEPKHTYVLEPVSGNAKYLKQRSDESVDSGQPLQRSAVNLDDVTICLPKDGYRDAQRLADNFAAFNQRLKYAHYRPDATVKSDPRSWWKYACKVILDQIKKAGGKMSWEQVLRYTRLRKKYISLYASLLKSDPSHRVVDDNKELEEIERELDIDLIVQWRMVAHKFVEQSVQSSLRKEKPKKSWWSFGWSNQSFKENGETFHFSEEDWERLNSIIGYKDSDDHQSIDVKKDAIQSSFEVYMRHNASKLIDGDDCLAELSCENLNFSARLYSEAKVFELKLGSYCLSSPDGLLAESATEHDSLVGSFSYKPFDVDVDWSMVAKASPCYMTYLKGSVGQIVKFFESNTVVSNKIALETAAAVQMTIEGVRRSAQEQMNRALKDQARFLLDLNIAAPKITIPTEFCPDGTHPTKLLLDLGNLIIRSMDDHAVDSSDGTNMYLQFGLVLSDVSAFLVDGDHRWNNGPVAQSSTFSALNDTTFLPVVDKCGVLIKLQQIRLENPLYPSTRLAIQLPFLGFHFSPARYHRLMEVAKIFLDVSRNLESLQPWDQADFEGWVSVLTWKGMANREAVWQRRYLYLVGSFLYILESPDSRSYKQYTSLRGKQVSEVPKESIGNEANVLAVCDAARANRKVIEDPNALILHFDSEELKRIWQSRLQSAIYFTSDSAAVMALSESSSDAENSDSEASDNGTIQIPKAEKVFISGVLDELKICFNYNKQRDRNFIKVLLSEESRLFEFRAIGGRVEIAIKENDMLIGTILKSLELEDLICGRLTRRCYLAQSCIQGTDDPSVLNGSGNKSCESNEFSNEGDDNFYEASENLVETSDYSLQLNLPEYAVAQGFLPSDVSPSQLPSFVRVPGLLPDDPSQSTTLDGGHTDAVDGFVKAQIVIYDQKSPHYNNVDTMVIVKLATLSFFCRRPMIFALMEFTNAINIEKESIESFSDTSPVATPLHDKSVEGLTGSQQPSSVTESTVKGLLGRGKTRVIFFLSLNMVRAQILLMKEDETRLATLSQDNLLTDIKVFPSSFSIKASIGNLRISDDSLRSDHMYFWSCDMRNPGGSSFVELLFCSYSNDDDDYEGYDYSLTGQLSEVRVVYLNRFIQEVVGYFTGLVPNTSTEVVKLRDQVTNSDKWFSVSEIEGSPAFKLDLSLTRPIILMPRRTDSLDFLKLDVVHITLRNTFQWLGGSKDEMNAIHLDILTVLIEDINLNVGIGNEIGDSIIQEVNGVSVVIQRSLRDLFHQVPSSEVTIEVNELRAGLSNKEYQIITECAQSNISEAPNIAPPLQSDSILSSMDSKRPSVTRESATITSEAQDTEAWINMKVIVIINLLELKLHSGITRDTPLAILQVSYAWLHYKSTTTGEGFISATVKSLNLLDDRVGTLEEFRLAVGEPKSLGHLYPQSSTDDEGLNVDGDVPIEVDLNVAPTMLIFDAKFTESLTSVSICLQRPQLLVALDFLLDVVEFFVPTVRGTVSIEDEDAPIHLTDAIILNDSTYTQPSAEFSLSPVRPLVVDDERFSHFIYDGNGGTLYLKDSHGRNLSSSSAEAVVFVGHGKSLQFKNVVIKDGRLLDSCIVLGTNSGYSAAEEDRVYLVADDEGLLPDISGGRAEPTGIQNAQADSSVEYTIELQAISPELTFYNTSKSMGDMRNLSNKLLHAQLDVFCRVVLKGDTMEMTANALGFTMESNGIRILEPFDSSVKYSRVSGKTNIHLSVSDILMNFSFSVLRLFLAVEEDLLAFLRTTSKKMTTSCSEFDKVGLIQNTNSDHVYAFWRARAPPGFAVLGDYLTPIDKPPSKGVLAVNTSLIRVKKPLSYKLVWPPLSSGEISDSNGVHGVPNALSSGADTSCSIWFPNAPKGYVAMGCVVSQGRTQPSLSTAFCVPASFVSPCACRDCIVIPSSNECPSTIAFWRVQNSVGTFLPADPTIGNLEGGAYEFRHVLFGLSAPSLKESTDVGVQASPSGHHSIQARTGNYWGQFEAVASFHLVWWNQGSGSRKKLSIWRPVVSHGMAYFGDVAVKGYEPPDSCVVFKDADDQLLKAPLDFKMVGQLKKQKGMESISFWMPQAPPGYVALGCVACKSSPKHQDFSLLRCIRSDLVSGDQFSEESVWDTSDLRIRTTGFSIWSVGNELGTFLVQSGYKKPSKRFALKLADQSTDGGPVDTVIDAKMSAFSAALFDDFGGLMVPLFNISFSGIGFSLHGHSDYLSSTVGFSLVARSYNDKNEAWEPVVEPVDGFLRYQYDLNSPGAASQLRLTTTRDLNINISISNANMILQAYASWNNFSRVHEPYVAREIASPVYSGSSIFDIHNKSDHYIIPQNKLGQDIFIRTAEIRGLPRILRMPSGDMKPLKVPVSKNMLDSHVRGNSGSQIRDLVALIIAESQFQKAEGLSSHHYSVAVRIRPDPGLSNGVIVFQQSARTCGSSANSSSSSKHVYVKWDEVFFFKVDSPDFYIVELIVVDLGTGDSVGFFSAPLKQIAIDASALSRFNGDEDGWIELSPSEAKDSTNFYGRLKCAVLFSPRSMEGKKPLFPGGRKTGFIQISPTNGGPWTTVRLNYAAPAACWRFGNCVVASEVRAKDGNRYVIIRSLVSVTNSTGFTIDLCLKPRNLAESMRPSNVAYLYEGFESNGKRMQKDESFEMQKGSRHLDRSDSLKIASEDQSVGDGTDQGMSLGLLKPGETFPLPLSILTKEGTYSLHMRPLNLGEEDHYAWGTILDKLDASVNLDNPREESGLCVSALEEGEKLLYCSQMIGTSSSSCQGIWLCLSIQATEIAKDIRSDPLHDWTISLKPPLCINNCLPFRAEYSVLELQSSGNFIARSRGIFSSGKTVNVYSADITKPLFLSLLPQKGWLPAHEAILISHPGGVPPQSPSLKSSSSGRIVQVVFEQNHDRQRPFMPKIVRVYASYWVSVARCPPLTCRLVDRTERTREQKVSLPFKSRKNKKEILEEITEEEFYDGYTIASAWNFKSWGLSISIGGSGTFGPVKELSSLGDMDGSLDLYAYDAAGYCIRLFISSKPCPYQSVPTKVISIRPYLTFTNRLGENLFIKFSNEDEPKTLLASDSRVSFLYRKSNGPDALQVRLPDTRWSIPIVITKEDTISVVLRNDSGQRRFLRIEIRGYEEGSRFIVVFRLGSTIGPIRIENRIIHKVICIRQSGFNDDCWTKLAPLTTTNFTWEDPYGQKVLDVEVHLGNNIMVSSVNLDLTTIALLEGGAGVQVQTLDIGNIRVIRFSDERKSDMSSDAASSSVTPSGNWGNSQMQKTQNVVSPMEIIVEMGVVGLSVVDHRPKELSYLYLERVYISYSTGYDGGNASRFKLIVGHLQLDNQLPLTVMPVLLASEQMADTHNPVLKMTLTICNENNDGILVFPYVYIRVTEKPWRLNIHEPIIWALVDFMSNLQLDRLPQSSNTTQVDPEIKIDLIDVSEIRLKVSFETAPAERPRGVLGVWSPILSAIGNAFKVQVHLRKVMQKDRFMRKSSVVPAITNRIWRDLIHNPLHLIFSVDVLGMTSSTLASISRGFAELSTDGQFLQLRSKQVWSRRITGVGDGIRQGTEALAQGVAFGVSGVVTKPVESARENGVLGLAHGLGRAFVGIIVQPVSGALDFLSLTVNGVGASFSRCLEILSNRTVLQRIRNPRAIHADGVLREYSEREATGQMVLYLAEASQYFGCAEIFKEPSKFAWSDYYEDHFLVAQQKIVLVTNKRVMLLQSQTPNKLDKKPCKILWNMPWEELLALELTKAGSPQPSHLILHLKRFKRSEVFARVIKCHTDGEPEGGEPQAVRICKVVRKMWKAHQLDLKTIELKVPSSQRHVYFSWSDADARDLRFQDKARVVSREMSSSGSTSDGRKFVMHSINFSKIWSSEPDPKGRCTLCQKKVLEEGTICSIWRPICPSGCVSIGDIAHIGNHPPNFAAVYRYNHQQFAQAVGFDLVWRNCLDDYRTALTIWFPRAPEGFVALGCVAVAGLYEPEPDIIYCVAESLVEEAEFESQKVWTAPNSYPWACHIYQMQSDAIHFVALRQPKEEMEWKPKKVLENQGSPSSSSEVS